MEIQFIFKIITIICYTLICLLFGYALAKKLSECNKIIKIIIFCAIGMILFGALSVTQAGETIKVLMAPAALFMVGMLIGLLFPSAPNISIGGLFKIPVAIICFPFKIIASIFRAIFKGGKQIKISAQMREQNKLAEKERQAQIEAQKARERQERDRAKQRIKDEKRELKHQEKMNQLERKAMKQELDKQKKLNDIEIAKARANAMEQSSFDNSQEKPRQATIIFTRIVGQSSRALVAGSQKALTSIQKMLDK